MAALHADIPDTAHLTSEDRLEELLQTFPFARATAPEVTSQLPIVLETAVEAIDDHADARTAAKSREEAGTREHRRPGGYARHAAHHRLHAEPRQAGAPMKTPETLSPPRPARALLCGQLQVHRGQALVQLRHRGGPDQRDHRDLRADQPGQHHLVDRRAGRPWPPPAAPPAGRRARMVELGDSAASACPGGTSRRFSSGEYATSASLRFGPQVAQQFRRPPPGSPSGDQRPGRSVRGRR